jgi:pimeloyl-ACP methyl ester carboxylesterase
MDPRIQYARTSDGVNIANWTMGEGPPLLHLPWGTLSNCQAEWRLEGCRRWYERLALRSTVIRYDPRGCGMSDPEEGAVAVDDLVKDIEAVVDSMGLKQVALLGVFDSGITAFAFAAKYPDRLSRLVLWCCYARQEDMEKTPSFQAATALIDRDPVIYSETLSRIVLGWSAGEEAQELAAGIREAVKVRSANLLLDTFHGFDALPLLPMITPLSSYTGAVTGFPVWMPRGSWRRKSRTPGCSSWKASPGRRFPATWRRLPARSKLTWARNLPPDFQPD